MKTLSREDELRLISKTKELVRKADAGDMARWFDTDVSDSDKLAMYAASWDALGLMPKADRRASRRSCSPEISPDMRALLIAGMLRCLSTSCSHVRSQLGILRYVFLAPRICVCEQCLPSLEGRFAEHAASQDHAGECDLCLTRGVTVFHSFHSAFNGAIYYGNVCPACRTLAVGTD